MNSCDIALLGENHFANELKWTATFKSVLAEIKVRNQRWANCTLQFGTLSMAVGGSLALWNLKISFVEA